MGVKMVLRLLAEMFPQVDPRILKAVAIEHSKDANAAVEAVLSEVLPYLSEYSPASSPSPEQHGVDAHAEDREEEAVPLRRRSSSLGKRVASSDERTVLSQNIGGHTFSNSMHEESTTREHGANSPARLRCAPVVDSNRFREDVQLMYWGHGSWEGNINSDPEEAPGVLSNASANEEKMDYSRADKDLRKLQSPLDNFKTGNENSGIMSPASLPKSEKRVNSVSVVPDDSDLLLDGKTYLVESNTDAGLLKEKDSMIEQELRDADDRMIVNFDMAFRSARATKTNEVLLETENSAVQGGQDADEDPLDANSLDKTRNNCESKQENEMALLEEMKESTKDNKRTLFLAMESVMDMMKEVELQERAMAKAQEEAAVSGLDILDHVDELKAMLAHITEANEMHAGEVYGEKAIIDTELTELQSRLLSLSEERDKTLAILDEMKQNLEARLVAAKELKEAAEQEKLENEQSARNSLAEVEAAMEKVLQEAKILQLEAEKNFKLRDFLMDRGRVVDSLQGEISVICKDARLLKDKFDEHGQLSESLSSSQTSLILATSGSFLRSREPCLQLELYETTKCPPPSLASTIHEKSPEWSPLETSPASSIYSKLPERSLQEMSSVHVQSPKRSPRETSPSASVNSHLQDSSLEDEKRITARFDDWEFFEYQ